ncbi:MAG: TIGR02281 family clan AA aspartic protease [Sphingopyxis sp.]|nr:TIGR02281 family clan AA aspartic protease [Sphingopyxis sp.]
MFARTLLLVTGSAFGLAWLTLQLAGRIEETPPAAAPVIATAADVAAPAPLPPAGSAQITRRADGHFHADVLLNGQRVEMLVDSGASMIVIDEALAARLGIRPAEAAYTGEARTANGPARFAPVRLASVRIGGIERRDVPAGVMRGNGLPLPLLGQSFLSTVGKVTINGDRMTLE